LNGPVSLDLTALLGKLDSASPVRATGHVASVVGLSIHAVVPDVRLGELVRIMRRDMAPLEAECVGFEAERAVLMPLDDTTGISPHDVVVTTGEVAGVIVGEGMMGRVLDGLGRPMDGGPALTGTRTPLHRAPPDPLERARIDTVMPTGLRVIDGLLTVGIGQRVGLFAGSGVGKSTLLGQIARQSEADAVVVCLVGERGREVREFLEDSLGEEGMKKSIVVCATSDTPSLVRRKCPLVATAIAEALADQGKHVLLLVDSITRFARACREVGLAAGEPPARRGYPPSVFSALPALLERSGRRKHGSITAFYTVLVEGSDMEEPVADEVRGILDGHIVLDRTLVSRGRFPAIDVLASLSRVMPAITSEAHRESAASLREALALYESKRDLVTLGAYRSGSDKKLDAALTRIDDIEAFLRQKPHERSSFAQTLTDLEDV
jgi:type III secretion protein N (ATPase)